MTVILENIEKSKVSDEIKKMSKLFVKRLFEIIIYVNFDEFLKIIELICGEILTLIIENEYESIHFVASFNMDKSNTWILLLFLDYLSKNESFNEKFNEKFKKIKISNKLVSSYNAMEEGLIIFFDDVIYSGNQTKNELPYLNKSKSVKIYAAVPYISISGYHNLKSKFHGINIFDNTAPIQSFRDSFIQSSDREEKKSLPVIFDEICNDLTSSSLKYPAFQCSPTNFPIYFDHKIADNISVLEKFLNYGTYPILSGETCKYTSIISNCDNDLKLESDTTSNYCLTTEAPFTESEKCYGAFYKKIQYTFENPSDHSVVTFKSQNETIVSIGQMIRGDNSGDKSNSEEDKSNSEEDKSNK
jgi:hypothetical protein